MRTCQFHSNTSIQLCNALPVYLVGSALEITAVTVHPGDIKGEKNGLTDWRMRKPDCLITWAPTGGSGLSGGIKSHEVHSVLLCFVDSHRHRRRTYDLKRQQQEVELARSSTEFNTTFVSSLQSGPCLMPVWPLCTCLPTDRMLLWVADSTQLGLTTPPISDKKHRTLQLRKNIWLNYTSYYYYYYYQRKWLRWHKIKRLQGHLTVSDSVTVQTSVKAEHIHRVSKKHPLILLAISWGIVVRF